MRQTSALLAKKQSKWSRAWLYGVLSLCLVGLALSNLNISRNKAEEEISPRSFVAAKVTEKEEEALAKQLRQDTEGIPSTQLKCTVHKSDFVDGVGMASKKCPVGTFATQCGYIIQETEDPPTGAKLEKDKHKCTAYGGCGIDARPVVECKSPLTDQITTYTGSYTSSAGPGSKSIVCPKESFFDVQTEAISCSSETRYSGSGEPQIGSTLFDNTCFAYAGCGVKVRASVVCCSDPTRSFTCQQRTNWDELLTGGGIGQVAKCEEGETLYGCTVRSKGVSAGFTYLPEEAKCKITQDGDAAGPNGLPIYMFLHAQCCKPNDAPYDYMPQFIISDTANCDDHDGYVRTGCVVDPDKQYWRISGSDWNEGCVATLVGGETTNANAVCTSITNEAFVFDNQNDIAAFYAHGGISFEDAKTSCQNKGLSLGLIPTEDAQKRAEFVINGLKQDYTFNRAWVGATDTDNDIWRWVADNSEVAGGFTNWDVDQPDNYNNNQDCMTILTDTYKWADSWCDQTFKGYLCSRYVVTDTKRRFRFVRVVMSAEMSYEKANQQCHHMNMKLGEPMKWSKPHFQQLLATTATDVNLPAFVGDMSDLNPDLFADIECPCYKYDEADTKWVPQACDCQNDRTSQFICEMEAAIITSVCEKWEKQEATIEVERRFGKYSTGFELFDVLSSYNGWTPVRMYDEESFGPLLQLVVAVSPGYGTCFDNINYWTRGGSNFKNWAHPLYITGDNCQHNFVDAKTFHDDSKLFVQCIDGPVTLKTYQTLGSYLVGVQACSVPQSEISDTSQLALSVTGEDQNGQIYSTNEIALTTDSVPLPISGVYYFSVFDDKDQPKFDSSILVALTSYGDDEFCYDTISVDGEFAISVTNHWIIGAAASQSQIPSNSRCTDEIECPSTSYAVFSWPVCGLEIIDVSIVPNSDTTIPIEGATVSGFTCSNTNRYTSQECSLSHTYQLDAYLSQSFDFTTQETKSNAFTISQDSTISFSSSYSNSVSANWESMGVGGSIDHSWSDETSQSDSNGQSSSKEWSRSESTSESSTIATTVTTSLTCESTATIAPMRKLSYSITFWRDKTEVETRTDIKLTLCSAFVEDTPNDDGFSYKYIYDIPGKITADQVTSCKATFNEPEILPNTIPCYEEQKQAFFSGASFTPNCVMDSNGKASLYDGCQCDEIDDGSSRTVCMCFDPAGNPLDDGSLTNVLPSETWQDACTRMNCPHSQWGSGPTVQPQR